MLLGKKKGKNSFGVLKIDMSKAYHRVRWNFLKAVLIAMNFDAKWVKSLLFITLSSLMATYPIPLNLGQDLGKETPSLHTFF